MKPKTKKTPKGDTTQAKRQNARFETLNKVARSWGYASWRAYETHVKNEWLKNNATS